jgi:hypothetical protein
MSSHITAHGTEEGTKGVKNKRNQWLQGTTTNGNDGEPGGSDVRCSLTTACSDKR